MRTRNTVLSMAGRLALSALMRITVFTACRRDVGQKRSKRAAVADTLGFPAPDRTVSRSVAPRWTERMSAITSTKPPA